jgi:uronate dehydrogenase
MKKILLTTLRQQLGQQYHFRCFDCHATKDAEDEVIANITNFEAILQAMSDIDAVIHLAANPDINQSWEDVYYGSISGTVNVLEAARLSGIKKIIYASTCHVFSTHDLEKGRFLNSSTPLQPDSYYGIGKACGEMLGHFFTQKYGLSVICLRIGWFKEQSHQENYHEQLMRYLCTPRDLAQLVQKSLETENLRFQIFYAVSANTQRCWDISNAQTLIGYHPQDNAAKLISKKARLIYYYRKLKQFFKKL